MRWGYTRPPYQYRTKRRRRYEGLQRARKRRSNRLPGGLRGAWYRFLAWLLNVSERDVVRWRRRDV